MRLVRPAWAAAYLTASLHAPRLHCTATGSHSVASALADIHAKIAAASAAVARPAPARLVAVSKTKPDALLLEAYAAGHRAFGENYVQELVRKAAVLPADIEWHFIGKLQSNKCKALVDGVPNLHVVETVDSERLASKLDDAVARSARAAPLGVMIQVRAPLGALARGWEGRHASCGAAGEHVAVGRDEERRDALRRAGARGARARQLPAPEAHGADDDRGSRRGRVLRHSSRVPRGFAQPTQPSPGRTPAVHGHVE